MAASVHRLPARAEGLAPPTAQSNLEAEQAVLGAALVSNALVPAVGFLRPEDFHEPAHGRIWTAILRDVGAGRRADPITLGPLFDEEPTLRQIGGRRYLADLARAAECIVNAVEYARGVHALARKRRLADAARRIVDRVETDREDPADAAEILAEAMPELEAAGRDDARAAGLSMAELADTIAQGLLDPPDLLSTGIPALDTSIGGLPSGYVLGFDARPAGFKSGTLHTIALNLAMAGRQCCYVTTEMSGKRLAQRMLGHLGGFKSEWFKHPDDRLVSAMSRLAPRLPGNLVVEEGYGMTLSALRQVASEHMTRRGCKVFFLDYYQRIRPDGRCESKSQHLEEVADWIQSFAYRHGTTWFVASQQNRDGENLGGDGLLRACDWLCRIRKNERRHYHAEHGMLETIWLDVTKSRDGTGEPVGSQEDPLLCIDPRGPHLAELPR